VNLIEKKEEKEEDAILQQAYERGVISAQEFAKADIELIKLKLALDDCLKQGIINQLFVDEVLEKPGNKTEIVKLTNELRGMLTCEGGYEDTREKHVNQGLTSNPYRESRESTPNQLRILELLMEPDQYYNQKRLSIKIGCCRQAIKNNTEKMEAKGLIKINDMKTHKTYEITEKGRSYYYDHVNPAHTSMRMWVRVHNVRMKGDIVGELPTNKMNEWKVYMTTWRGHTREFTHDDFTVTVNLTSKSAILYFSVVPAPTLDEAEIKLGNAVGWIVKKLSQEKIYIENLRQNTEASYALLYDPIAEEFFKHEITYDGSSFSIDHSHGIPETEFHSKEKFKNYKEFVELIENGQINPQILKEMQNNYLSKPRVKA
jgi:predicted transcriptional regulator